MQRCKKFAIGFAIVTAILFTLYRRKRTAESSADGALEQVDSV